MRFSNSGCSAVGSALALGERVKTTECCFYEAKSTKQGVVGAIYDCNAQRLCDLTGGVAEDAAGSSPVTPTKKATNFTWLLFAFYIFSLLVVAGEYLIYTLGVCGGFLGQEADEGYDYHGDSHRADTHLG